MQVPKELKKEHYDKKTKLESMLEYFDCTVCLMMHEDLFECPNCRVAACTDCLSGYSKADHAANP